MSRGKAEEPATERKRDTLHTRERCPHCGPRPRSPTMARAFGGRILAPDDERALAREYRAGVSPRVCCALLLVSPGFCSVAIHAADDGQAPPAPGERSPTGMRDTGRRRCPSYCTTKNPTLIGGVSSRHCEDLIKSGNRTSTHPGSNSLRIYRDHCSAIACATSGNVRER